MTDDIASTYWRLEDVETRAKQFPGEFEIPSRAQRMSLIGGHAAKLCFLYDAPHESGCTGERMWVVVELVRTDGGYVGRLANAPALAPEGGGVELKYGDRIVFAPRHVLDVDTDPFGEGAE